MYNQLFYTLPVFIDQWVHTAAMYDAIHKVWPWLASALDTQNVGAVASEMLVNVDAMFIVILQIAVSTFVMKYKPLNAMIVGILICSIGMSLTLFTQNGFFLVLSIFIFALGEMSSSPKTSEYIARIAPKDKVALYMGCSFLPYAGGISLQDKYQEEFIRIYQTKFHCLRKQLLKKALIFRQLPMEDSLRMSTSVGPGSYSE